MTRLLIYAFTVFSAAISAIIASALWFDARTELPPKADAILVLGAGMDADGTLHRSTRLRVEAGVSLYFAGVAPRLVMTGGRLREDAPAAGEQMAAHAQSLGVPDAAILSENASHSTLQNALLTKLILDQAGIKHVVLVTEGFHMARSLATMRWAGIDVVAARTSTAFRRTVQSSLHMVTREVMAWGLNLVRVPVWHVGGWIGFDEAARLDWLK